MRLTPKYHRRKTAARALLLAGYLVFFAAQFNHRYYDIANFFIYKPQSASLKMAELRQAPAAHAYQDNTKRPAHLGIDKRFSHKLSVRPVPIGHQAPVPSYIIITRKALPPPVVYSTPDLPTNCL